MSNDTFRARTRRYARAMRREPTDAEQAMWHVLRDRRLAGLKWRRQVPIGRYIIDFVSFDRRMVIECDGSQHADNVRDDVRDAWLREQGFEVIRFWNEDVLIRRTSVIETILARCGLRF